MSKLAEDLFIEPGRVAKLEGSANSGRQAAEEVAEERGILFKVRRKLE
jgi:hypothetical protein